MYKLLKSVYNSIKGDKRMDKTYTIIVHKEEDCFWAECKELEGCFAQAKTIEELKKLMVDSIYLYFQEDEEMNECETKISNIKLQEVYA